MASKRYATPRERKTMTPARRRAALYDKQFIVWDGEGGRAEGKRKPQNYILFGYYDGIDHEWITGERLSTAQCLELIITAGDAHPGAIHVSFAFGYDVDQIIRSLSVAQLDYLRRTNHCRYGDKYRLEHIPGKWFRVTEYGSTYAYDKTDRKTVTIFDTWGFFQASLVAALKSTIPDHPLMRHMPEIEAGKNRRSVFTYNELEYITQYWKIENELFYALVNRLREMLFSVGLHISRWHGPGALASYVYATRNIANAKADCGAEIYDAARYAYAGGRFERYHIGRHKRVWGYDINSAYPNAIAKLPDLTEGTWNHVTNPRRVVEFGVYRVRLRGPAISRAPSPLFHRDSSGNITYPWRTDGWYWSPEIMAMIDAMPPGVRVEIIEGWEYTGWKSRPFAFVADVYAQRREMKAAKNGAQMALKLLLNSLYGKMAQRAGWERTGDAPKWHQLEWAGWVTSYTRAMLYRVMASIPYDKLIAVETDGLYTTATPDELGMVHSNELGGWEISYYDELTYLQSGVYAGRSGDKWFVKFRGLDRNSFGDTTVDSAATLTAHARKLIPLQPRTEELWPSLQGTTTRFVGYRNALFRQEQNRGPMKMHHCVWETDKKEISCGSVGKRVHSPKMCQACQQGFDAYAMPHETIIKSRTTLDQQLQSTQHDIPWLDNENVFEWRKRMDELDGLLSE